MSSTIVLRFSRYHGNNIVVKKRIQQTDKVTCLGVPRCQSIYVRRSVPSLPSVLNAIFIVLVAAAGGVVLIKVKLLAISEWCYCHIFNLYYIDGLPNILGNIFCTTWLLTNFFVWSKCEKFINYFHSIVHLLYFTLVESWVRI